MNDSNKKQILDFLRKHGGMVLSTATKIGKPEAAYVFYAVNDESELFILTNGSAEKCVNARENKEVAFVITDEEKLITLQGKGEIMEITSVNDDIRAFNSIIEVITKKVKNWPPPTGRIRDGGHVILKIKSKWLRLRDYANSTDFVSDNIETLA